MEQKEQKRFTFSDMKDILIAAMALQGRQIQVPEDRNFVITDLGVDSLAMVQILLDVQSRFGVVIPQEDIGQLQTIGGAIDYMDRRLQQ
jgi:acyl carrier protein